jgi:hypothetical protein
MPIGLTGTWQLTETLFDPGDGSATWQPVSDKTKKISFKPDGSIQGTALGDLVSYKIIDSTRVEFARKDDTKFIYRYKVASSTLMLNPPCIEACGLKFRKEN